MAKSTSKTQPPDDFADQAEGHWGEEAAPEDAEKAAMSARIRELEGQLAAEKSARLVEAEPGVRADYWRVELLHAKTHVVRARDAANAWDLYREEMGVLASDHRAKVSPATREEWLAAQADRLKVTPEEFGRSPLA
jgi:hypothetical protein